jgi:hypothetical protein
VDVLKAKKPLSRTCVDAILYILEFKMIFPGKKIALNRVGPREISTVELPRFDGEDRVQYETCVFLDDGSSNVVGRYDTIEEAHHFHNAIVKHELFHAGVAKTQQ